MEIKVPPPDHVHFTKQGRAYADMDRLIDSELNRWAEPSSTAEHERLRSAVVEAAKRFDKEFTWTGDFTSAESARAYDDFKRTMREFNQHDLGKQ